MLKKIIAVFFLLFLIAAAILEFTSPVKKKLLKKERLNILVTGISQSGKARHAEVISLLSYEPGTGFLDLLSIPRDTKFPVPYEVSWKRIQKADEIYYRFFRKHSGKESLYRDFIPEIENFLKGYFHIDHYLQIDYMMFKGFVDALGGLEIEVLRPMSYDDNAQDLHIHFSTGVQVMSGARALEYVRFRDKITGDIGRQARQHRFLKQLLAKINTPGVIAKFPAIIRVIRDNSVTDLKMTDLMILADEFRSFRDQNFRIQRIPGHPEIKWGKSYWSIEGEAMTEVLDVINNSARVNMPVLQADLKAKSDRKITAEVWNAGGVRNRAKELTRFLRKRNIDVVRNGNFGIRKKYTQIISRTGDLIPARIVSRITGCSNIKTELDSGRMVDISFVIGEDFKVLWKDD